MALYRFALFTVFASFLLVIAGGLVTSTGSGLSVPDWPLSYGTLFPPMVGGIRFEHTHRLIAAAVGLLTLLLTGMVLARERRVGVRWLAVGAFGLVVLQGLLGGLTVLLQLPDAVSIAHACLGQTFFATLTVLAVVLSPAWTRTPLAHPADQTPDLARGALFSTAAVYLQLILGASLRHIGWAPRLLLAHLGMALVVLFLAGRTAGAVLNRFRTVPLFQGPARAISWLLLIQLGLGLATWMGGRQVLIATGHVATGALLLACSAALTVSLFYFAVHPANPGSAHRSLRIYLELTKPRLTFLAVVSAALGFLMASRNVDPLKFAFLLAGTTLIGAGASSLNQLLEIEPDSRMARTRNRPLPSGRISPDSVLAFGAGSSIAGLWLLTLGCSLLAGVLAALTLVTYLFLYTPLKRRSALCTLVGAIPGALPPLIGWAAAAGGLNLDAWFLFFILFVWQLPHFLAIAWTHREDYGRAGFRMLPVVDSDPRGGLTFRQITLYCAALIPISLAPAALGQAGWFYFVVALAGGVSFLGFGLATARIRSEAWSRRLFLASVLYLPLILTALTLERML